MQPCVHERMHASSHPCRYNDCAIQGVYNKQSCRECGAALEPHSFCAGCREHTSWVCGQCGRIEDYTHVHDYCGPGNRKEIVVETAAG